MRLKVDMGNNMPGNQKLTTEEGELIEGVKEIKWSSQAVERPLVTVTLFAERVAFDNTNEEEPSDVPD